MTARICPNCASAVGDDAAFCGECGSRLVPEPVMAAQAPTVEAQTHELSTSESGAHQPPPGSQPEALPPASEEPATARWSYGPPLPPPPPAAPPVYPPPPVYPAPAPSGGHNTGLVVGLVIASVVALAGVAAAVMLAVSAGGDGVETSNAAATTPAQTVVTQVIRERSTPRRSGSERARSRSASRSVQPLSGPSNSSPKRERAVNRVTDAQRRAAAESAVRRHWALIESGQYSSAFNLLASSASTASQSAWIAEHEEDDLSSADVSVSASLTSPTTARVNVLRLRTVANSGCFTWAGSYDVAKLGGTWRITKANLSRSPC